MTRAADDRTVEDAFEAILAGRPAPQGAAGMAAFTEAVRTTATSPGRPNAALAELLATGLLADQSRPSPATARSAGASPSRASRVRIRRRFAMFFPALLAKLLSAGAVAQAATGATVVVVAFAGAGAAGVLPGPVQDTFTSIVSDETDVPVEEEPLVEAPVEEVPVEEALVEETPTDETLVEGAPVEQAELTAQIWADAGPTDDYASFGAWVSAGSSNEELRAQLRAAGRTFGEVVSGWARNKGMTAEELAEELAEEGVELDELTEEDVVVPHAPQADTAEVEQTERTTQERGNGNGRGNAGGNRGGNDNGHGNGRN